MELCILYTNWLLGQLSRPWAQIYIERKEIYTTFLSDMEDKSILPRCFSNGRLGGLSRVLRMRLIVARIFGARLTFMAPSATIPISRVVYSVWCLSVTQKHLQMVVVKRQPSFIG